MDDALITSAANASMNSLRQAMNLAFADYSIPMQLSAEQFQRMMNQRGFDPQASFIGKVDGNIAGFWLMSVRDRQAYLISSGTTPRFRSRGLSTKIANKVLQHLRTRQISTFQTEVLEGNLVAQGLYRRAGMTKNRDLGCCRIDQPAIGKASFADIKRCQWLDVADHALQMRDWSPTWQNSDISIMALSKSVTCFEARAGGRPAGYLALMPSTETVLQIAVHRNFRRQGIGTALLTAATALVEKAPLRLINYDATDDGFAAFLAAQDSQRTEGQFELLLNL